ncbi:hypothetical protein ES703_120275 [subsurface metagenome]
MSSSPFISFEVKSSGGGGGVDFSLDGGKYKDCITECAKSVEAELRVRMGLFDEQLTLGMLIDRGMKKGMDVLKEFKFVNILLNRIEHENYRPTRLDAQKAVEITTKILMS